MAIVKKQNICVGRKYNNAQGEEKTHWTTIGNLYTNDTGSQFLRINVTPVEWDGTAQIFDERNDNDPFK